MKTNAAPVQQLPPTLEALASAQHAMELRIANLEREVRELAERLAADEIAADERVDVGP